MSRMPFLGILYYSLTHGIVLAGVIFSFFPGFGGRAPRMEGKAAAGRMGAFRGLLASMGLGTAGMAYDFLQFRSASPSLWLSYTLSLISLASISGVIAFVPIFFGSFVRHRGKRAALAAYGVAALALLPLQPFILFPSNGPVFRFLSAFGLIGDVAAFVLALGYGMAAGAAALRQRRDAAAGEGRWISLLAIMMYGSLALAPLSVACDFLVLPRKLWGWELPRFLPLLTALYAGSFIATGIREIREGHEGQARSLVPEAGDAGWSGASLTPRETEVARMLVSGYTYRMIGERLGIAPATVKSHVLKVYEKTGAGNKVELLTFADRP
jgi:DNA-binding CsgD family transcriptional regulator